MRVRVSRIFFGLLVFWPILCAVLDPLSGLITALIALLCALPLVVSRRSSVHYAFALFTSGAVFLGYLMRVPMLLLDPGFFIYIGIGTPDIYIIRGALLKEFFFLIPFFVGVSLILCGPGFLLGPSGERGERKQFLERFRPYGYLELLYRYRYYLIVATWILLVLRYWVITKLGVGMMIGHRQWGFIDRLIPDLAIMFSVAIVSAIYWVRLSFPNKVVIILTLGAVAGFIVMSGSKAGLAYVMFGVIFALLLHYGDFQIRLPMLISTAVGVFLIIFLIFPYAQMLRWSMASLETGFGGGLIEAIYRYSENYDFWSAMNLFTGRTMGFEGIIVLHYQEAESLREYYCLENIGSSFLQGILPNIHFYTISLGKMLSMVLFGHSLSVQHGGALGLIASTDLLVGGFWTYPALLFIGIIWSGLFRFFWRIFRGTDFHVLACALYMFWAMKLLISGNFDRLSIEFVELVGHAVLIYICVKFIEILERPEHPYVRR